MSRVGDFLAAARIAWQGGRLIAQGHVVAHGVDESLDRTARATVPVADDPIAPLSAADVKRLSFDGLMVATLERLERPTDGASALPLLHRQQIAYVLRARHPAYVPLADALLTALHQEVQNIGRSVVGILTKRFGRSEEGVRRLERLVAEYARMAADQRSDLGAAFLTLPPLAARQAHEAWARAVR